MFGATSGDESRVMTFNDYFAQMDHEHRSERVRRTIRNREGSRARAARLRRRAGTLRLR